MQISDRQQLLGTTNEEHLPNGYEISFGHDENTRNRQSWRFPSIMKLLNFAELFILKMILCYTNFTSKKNRCLQYLHEIPRWFNSKESTCNAGDNVGNTGLIPGSGRSPGGGRGNPLQYSCLENPHGQRSLVGYSPRGLKESDMTERLSAAHI